MSSRFLVGGVFLLWLFPLSAAAQITVPNTFVAGTTASASQVNANFSVLATNALNRTGGTLTGNIVADAGVTVDGVDIGSVLGGSGTLTLASLTLTTFTCTGCVGATQLAASGVTAASYGGAATAMSLTVDADGRITSLSDVAIAIAETAVADGSLLARVGGNETISGTWTFSNAVTSSSSFSGTAYTTSSTVPQLRLYESDQVADERYWLALAEGKTFYLSAYNDALASSTPFLAAARGTGTAISSLTLTAPTITLTGAATVTGALTAESYVLEGDSSAGMAYDSGTDKVTLDAGGWVTLSLIESTNRLCLVTNGGNVCLFGGTAFAPTSDGVLSLGQSGGRWTEVWAIAGTINTSDQREKRDIRPTKLGLEFLDALKPVEYFWREGPLKGKFYGFLAQDLDRLGFEGVDKTNPNRLGLRYTELLAPLVKGVQELHAEVHQVETQNKMLQEEIEFLAKRIRTLEKGYGERRAIEE